MPQLLLSCDIVSLEQQKFQKCLQYNINLQLVAPAFPLSVAMQLQQFARALLRNFRWLGGHHY